jgi:hypothetical protein
MSSSLMDFMWVINPLLTVSYLKAPISLYSSLSVVS